MKLIAHRGNTKGKSEDENKPKHIEHALKRGFDAEVDIWYSKQGWFLGHDAPIYKIPHKWIIDHAYGCWFHAKNLRALKRLLDEEHVREVFWHENDDYTLTKGGYIWTFPGKETTTRSIINLHDEKLTIKKIFGVCSNEIELL